MYTVCLPVGPSPRRSVGRSVAPSVGLPPPVGRPVCLPARLPVGMSVCPPLCRTVGLSACLPAYITVCLPVGLSPRRSVGRSVAARRPVAHRSSLLAPSTQAIFACVLACRPVGLSLAPSHSDSPSGDTRRGHATTAPQVPSATREAAAPTGIPTACLAARAVASVIPSC